MFSAQDMQSVRIVAPKAVQRKVIEELYNQKALHVKVFARTKETPFEDGTPFKESERLSEKWLAVQGMLSALNVKGTTAIATWGKKESSTLNQVKKAFDQLEKERTHAHARKKELEKTLQSPWAVLGLNPKHFAPYKSMEVFAGTTKFDPRPGLTMVTSNYSLFSTPAKDGFTIALFVEKKHAAACDKILRNHGFKAQEAVGTGTKKEAERELAKLEKKLEKLKRQRAILREKHGALLLQAHTALGQRLEKTEIPSKFGTSAHTFLLEGWVPRKRAAHLETRLREITKEKIHVERVKDGKDPPTALDNPRIFKPFEALTELYALPKYGEIDPTALMAITFPLFFGFMLGDIGYGLITFSVFYIGYKKLQNETLKALMLILMLSSLATILFGFVFDEIFGLELHAVLEGAGIHTGYQGLIHRGGDHPNIPLLLLITLLVGILHVTLGLVLGFRETLKHHGLVHALAHKGSWLLIEFGLIFLILGMAALLPGATLPAAGLLLAGILLFVKGEGAVGLVELPSIVSHILSYMRLLGFGLASVILAQLVNLFTGMFFQLGGFYMVIAIFILLLGHLFNLLLGTYGPFIQSLRLHYVEFFSKFYQGGGKKYAPFGVGLK